MPTNYQTFWPRFWALFIDGLVFAPVAFFDGYFTSPERGPVVIIAWTAVTYALLPVYNVLLHARYGQTLGKMATRVKVLDLSEGHIPTLRQAFLREIVQITLYALDLCVVVYLAVTGEYALADKLLSLPGRIWIYLAAGALVAELAVMASNDKRRALHDCIAGTVVVRLFRQLASGATR